MSVAVALPAQRNATSVAALGAPAVVVVVYLNLSETLVRYHHFPSILQGLLAAVAFFAWVQRDTAPVTSVVAHRLTIAITVYLLVAFASTAWAVDVRRADERFSELLKAFAIYVLLGLVVRTEGALRKCVVALVIAAALLGVLILYQVATGSFDNEFGGLGRVKQAFIYGDLFDARVAGPVGDPNFFARMLLLPIAPAVVLGFQARERWKRIAFLLAAAIIMATLATTYSRGAMLALGVIGVLLLPVLHVRWRSTVLAAAALLVVVVLLPPSVTGRFITIEEILPSTEEPLHPDSSFEERRLLMHVAWSIFSANPVAGAGIGNYAALYEDYAALASSNLRPYNEPSGAHFPHNLPLEIAAETGLIGLLSFGAMAVTAWLTFRRAARELNAESGSIATALSISLAGFFVASLFLHLSEPRTLFLMLSFAFILDRLGAGTAMGAAA